jgi:Zn-dependent M32 family carboxypeptidase
MASRGAPIALPCKCSCRLKQRLREISDLNAAGSVLNWDQATYMPQAGAGARGRQLAMAFRINCSTARLSSLAWRQQFEIGLKALEKLKASKSGNALYSADFEAAEVAFQ